VHRRGDAVVSIFLRMLRASAYRCTSMLAGDGMLIRAIHLQNGFEVSVCRAKDGKRAVKLFVETRQRDYCDGRKLMMLVCAKCGRKMNPGRQLFLDWDSVTAQCKTCMGLNGAYIPKSSQDDYDEKARFYRLIKKKFLVLAAKHEAHAIRAQKPEEFFSERPYLVPPFFQFIKEVAPDIYRKSLKELARRYAIVLKKHKWHPPGGRDGEWMERKLEQRVIEGYYISDKESECLKRHLQSYLGNPSGTKPAPSSSPPTETACSSSKTRSKAAMSANLAKARAVKAARIAAAKAATSASQETSNALPAEEQAV
jgi:hypothetical protein